MIELKSTIETRLIPKPNVEQKIVGILKSCHIDTILTLPCDRIKNLLPLISPNFKEIPITREEEGIGLAAGLFLASKRPALLIQSTGIGNSLNAIASLHMTYNLPLPILASWRGVYKEGIAAHVHFGKCLPGILESTEIPYLIVESASEMASIKQAIETCFENHSPYVVLLSPKIWENSLVKPCAPIEYPKERNYSIDGKTFVPKATQTRFEMIKGIIPYIKGKIIVSNIGFPSRELYAVADQPTNFYMLGSLGQAITIGTGIAIGQQKKTEVVVLEGDGGLLMNPNALSSLVQEHPENLTVIVFDNCAYGSTGCQKTFSSNLDLGLFAKVYGIKNTATVSTPDELLKVLWNEGKGPRLIHTMILPRNAKVPNIPLSPVEIRNRFINTIN